ncbi:MAG: (d)CMP kinase [Ruminococcaceae bacterium]|nr:(d)CMP kinase [Oscillospiraceae bacterium]
MINVALDGPSGAGKSTIAKRASEIFGFTYIDTGAMFRSLAYKALSEKIQIKSQPQSVVSMLERTNLDIKRSEKGQLMILDGKDITDFIRTPEVSKGASDIAVIPQVREWLLKVERELAGKYDCIMDGRDIGTSVLPDADVKIFITASAEARAKRRHRELLEKGIEKELSEVLEDMKYRDAQDSQREVSPLKMADDAIFLDTSDLSFEESVNSVCDLIRKVIN